MKVIRLFAVFAATIFASAVFIFKSHEKEDEVEMYVTELSQDEVNCTKMLDTISPPFPALLIDHRILELLKKNACKTNDDKVRVAVDVRYAGEVRKEAKSMYDIVYYERPADKDYLRFLDNVTRITPRITYSVYNNFSVPADIERFFEYWKRSEFIKCIGLKVRRQTTSSYLPIDKTLRSMSMLMRFLVSFDIYPFLNGGTLLGWFRECGIISHTYDVDFAAFIEEYNPEVLEHLQNNTSKFILKRKLGRVNDSFEFTFRPSLNSRPSIDLFWMYTSGNESWVGGTSSDGSKFKYTYPRFTEICAGDLLGYIFWVPCDPETIILNEYGPEWYKDFPTNQFSWSSSHFNVRKNGKWTKHEMKEVYQTF